MLGGDGGAAVPDSGSPVSDAGLLADSGTVVTDSGRRSGGCDPSKDEDGDTVADALEGESDPDGDGTPSRVDDDSDGDGITDAEENTGGTPCSPRDTDGDLTPDFLDTDSDNDGLTDLEERNDTLTNPYEIDTDGDSVTDLGEVRGSGTDPNDRLSTIPEGDFFVVLPHEGEHQRRNLRFGTEIEIADVYFLIDTTGSMEDPIANVRTSLSTIAGEIRSRIPDVQMGVGHFRDFPLAADCNPFFCDEVYGVPRNEETGFEGDVPYQHLQDITAALPMVQRAIDGLTLGNGADFEESQTEALYQTATGAGGSWRGDEGRTTVATRLCTGRRTGYPCFRPGALPIVVLVTDADWHNGPGGSDDYDSDVRPAPATFAQASAALNGIGARFIGVAVQRSGETGGRSEARAMATATGSVNAAGAPLVFDAFDGTVSSAIVDGVEALASGTPQDVNTRQENVAGNPDGFDATRFILSVTPREGFRDGMAGRGYASKNTTTFVGVIPGTEVEFQVEFGNDVRPGADTAQIFKARIVVLGNGVTDLDTRNVYIVVPPADAEIIII